MTVYNLSQWLHSSMKYACIRKSQWVTVNLADHSTVSDVVLAKFLGMLNYSSYIICFLVKILLVLSKMILVHFQTLYQMVLKGLSYAIRISQPCNKNSFSPLAKTWLVLYFHKHYICGKIDLPITKKPMGSQPPNLSKTMAANRYIYQWLSARLWYCGISNALAMEILQSCNEPSIHV